MKEFELNKEGWENLKEYISTIENKDKYFISVKRKKRSYEQIKYYFSALLPALLYFLKDEIKINNTDELHIYLKDFYCYENKQEYFKPVIINSKKIYINTFSINFERASQYEINLYLSFIENNLNKLITIDADNFNDLIDFYSKNIK